MNFTKRILCSLATGLLLVVGIAQEASVMDSASVNDRLIRTHSADCLPKGSFQVSLDLGLGLESSDDDELLGMKDGDARVGIDFSPLRSVQFGAGISIYGERLDGYLKYNFLQNDDFLLTAVAGMFADLEPWEDTTRTNYFTSRLGYDLHVVAAKQFGSWNFQIAPGIVHRNLVSLSSEANDVINVGFGVRYSLSDALALMGEYHFIVADQLLERYMDPINIGLNYASGSSQVKFWLGNSAGLNERAYITETEASLADGELRIGLGYSRKF